MNDLFATLNHQVGQKDEAINHLDNLLEFNSCNYNVYYKILKVKGVELFD